MDTKNKNASNLLYHFINLVFWGLAHTIKRNTKKNCTAIKLLDLAEMLQFVIATPSSQEEAEVNSETKQKA